jgi:hypothetical protein
LNIKGGLLGGKINRRAKGEDDGVVNMINFKSQTNT